MKEEILLHKTVLLPWKVYDFSPTPVARKVDLFEICEKAGVSSERYASQVMPEVREVVALDEEEEEAAVFQSPEWDPDGAGQDQGASPQLRRSARKRKSTAGDDTLKGSSSKKKKASPKKMPKTARSPPKPQANGEQPSQTFEALLLAMEGRLTAKIEKASEASREAAHQAKLNSEGLELLEQRVDANENCLMEALRMSETRIMAKVQSQMQDICKEQVGEMVNERLHEAGFDPDLTAADLTIRRSAVNNDTTTGTTYASAAAKRPQLPLQTSTSKQDKQESKFDIARRSLRLWPIEGGKKDSLEAFLTDKLRLEPSFLRDDLGQVVISKPKEPRNKNASEYIVTFESKQIRDAVKAKAANLANFREEAGMRLQFRTTSKGISRCS